MLVNHQEVTVAYYDADHINNTIVRQALSVSISLSQRALQAIGDFINGEHADVLKYQEVNCSAWAK